MTIANCEPEIRDIIQEHHVVGAEAIINALVRATKNERYLQIEDLIRLMIRANRRENENDIT